MRLPYGVDANEFANLKSWSRTPLRAVVMALHVLRIMARAAMFRFFPARVWYPEKIAKLARKAAGQTKINSDFTPVMPGEINNPKRIRLAKGYLSFSQVPNWRTTFNDSEQYVSLHRWNWLLSALSDEPEPVNLNWGIAMMRSWLKEMSPLPEGLASESYTTGERIANAILFARIAGKAWNALPADINQALTRMAFYLAETLEYFGTPATGNHPFNNARALYLASKALKLGALEVLAKAVIKERLQAIFTEDGFMREGSSHYQFLFTRWLLEVQLCAREFGDDAMLDLLEIPTRRAVNRCKFFIVQSNSGRRTIPLFGDISPDCEPEWLVDLPWSALVDGEVDVSASGWAALWNRLDAKQACVQLEDVGKEAFYSFSRSGWYRLNWRGWTAFWHADGGGRAEQASHEHQDFGALVLYRDGRECLIDVGRPNYERGSIAGNHSITFTAHNTITVDGVGPMLTPRDRFFPYLYRNADVVVDFGEMFDGQFKVSIRHTGYARLAGCTVEHTRSFNFDADAVEICDRLDGNGSADIVTHWHWASKPDDIGLHFFLTGEGTDSRTLQGNWIVGGETGSLGWRYTAYGVGQSCAMRRHETHANLPIEQTWRVELKEKD